MVNANLPVGTLCEVLAILGAVGLWCSSAIVTGNMITLKDILATFKFATRTF